MAELKTKKTTVPVGEFLKTIEDKGKRADAKTLVKMMREATGNRPKMWGPNIIGFGDYHFVYASGREGDWFLTGFSPRKRDLSLYLMCDLSRAKALLKKLGKHKTGKSCLYIHKLEDVDLDVLRELIAESVAYTKEKAS